MGAMAGYPVNEAFRREVRDRALAVARELTLARGWQHVRFIDVADAVGVSRPTMYSEFGSKAGLGEALVLAETSEFLTGIVTELGPNSDDPVAAAKTAVRYTVLAAEQNPLLHGILTNVGDSDLLLLLTSQSGPVLPVAVEVLSSWFAESFPDLPPSDLSTVIELLVRLTLSHLVQPTHGTQETIGVLERSAELVVTAALVTVPSSS